MIALIIIASIFFGMGFGYYFFRKTSEAVTNNDKQSLCSLSALGLIFSAIAIPLTFLVRHLLTKYGPKED